MDPGFPRWGANRRGGGTLLFGRICAENCMKMREMRLRWGECIPGQVRIQDLVGGGAPGAEAESCQCSEAESNERSEQFVAGVQGP